MRKTFVLLCLVLMLALPVVVARTVPAYGNYYGQGESVVRSYNRYQIVRVNGNSFTRTIDGVRHALSISGIDRQMRKVIFEDRFKGQKQKIEVQFDTNNLGTLVVAGKSFPFQVDVKRKSVSISYGV